MNNNFNLTMIAVSSSVFTVFIRSFAFVVSLMCIWGLFMIRNASSLNKCLLAISFSDALYIFLGLLMYPFRISCKEDDPALCGEYVYLLVLINYIVFSEFLTSCLAFFSILMEVFLVIQRIMIVRNKISLFKNLKGNFICLTVCIISILIYIPVLFVRRIEPEENSSTRRQNATIINYK